MSISSHTSILTKLWAQGSPGGRCIGPALQISGSSDVALSLLFLPLLWGVCASSAQASRSEDLVVRITSGTDEQDSTAVLRRAIDEQRRSNVPTEIVLTGRFKLDRALRIGPGNDDITIEGSDGRSAEIVASPHAERAVEVIGTNNVRVARLRLSGFSRDGIFVSNSQGVVIENNTVRETLSGAWSEGAIHLTGTVAGAIISDNRVEGADYAGIIVDTDARSDISGLRITGNVIHSVCRRIADCGAIHVNDRAGRSRGIVIEKNVIDGFGPQSVGGRGIYLDDGASYVVARANMISGPGVFAFEIHGGHHNEIDSNMIDMTAIRQAILYQPQRPNRWEDMTDNVFASNCFVDRASTAKTLLGSQIIPVRSFPAFLNNQICDRRSVDRCTCTSVGLSIAEKRG